MPTTSYTDPAAGFKAWALQARTDTAGVGVDDADGEEARLPLDLFTEGILAADAYKVVEDSPAGLTVVVGSGSAEADIAIVAGTASGQGKYMGRLQDGTVDVTVPAPDASNPRIDEVYLVPLDDQYDSGGLTLFRIGYREGDPAASPSAPGPDGNWDAFLHLASIAVGAAVTEILNADITDERVWAGPRTARYLANSSNITVSDGVEGNILTTSPTEFVLRAGTVYRLTARLELSIPAGVTVELAIRWFAIESRTTVTNARASTFAEFVNVSGIVVPDTTESLSVVVSALPTGGDVESLGGSGQAVVVESIGVAP